MAETSDRKYGAVIAAAEALEERVFRPKLEAAQQMEDTFGSADWEPDGRTLLAVGGSPVGVVESEAAAAYLSEYDPASVRRASGSKLASVTRMLAAISSGDRDDVKSATPAFVNLAREYSARARIDPDAIERELASS